MILIVDDRSENIFALRRTLEVNGFDVDSAESGEEALKKILKTTYSLIILDVQMPGMDGFEVAEAISGYSKARDIPIIFLSAVNTDKRFITKGYKSGGIDYVTKPVDPDVFILKVKTLHRIHEQNRELNDVRLSLLEEIDTRKKAERQLQVRMQELRSILEALPQIAFTMAPTGEIEFANQHWFVYSEEITRLPVFHPDDQGTGKSLFETLGNGEPLMSEVRIKNLITGTYRYHLLRIIPVKQEGKIAKWVGTFTDIDEQKRANEVLEAKVRARTEELQKKNEELETSNHELQQFASVASHDLKEPLRKIQVFSSIIKDRHLEDSEEARSKISRVIEAAQRMNGLINDLLDYSRLSIKLLFKKTNIRHIIGDIERDLEFSIHEKNAVINVAEMPVIDAIPGQVRQVFQNLISNSLKFSKAGEPPVINISSELFEEDSIAHCRIIVSDNGIGFNEKYLGKIFTIFQRLNDQQAYAGTGIGLAIVKKIVEKHNGSITARSREEEGATFIITLPVVQASMAGAETDQHTIIK
ncbi:MAG: ATP-binding protein [Bacteroidota bacterium]